MKTSRLQRWFGPWTVVLLFFVLLSGSVQAASLGERFERTLGGSAVPEILKQYGGEHVLPIGQRMWVEEIFRRLVEVTEREDVDYTLTILNSSELNAFALPGGYVFITRGLISAIGRDEAELAAVLGHEITHIERKHGVNAVLRQMGLAVLLEVGVMTLDLASADLLRVASATLLQLVSLGWGREAEYEADLSGQALAVKAGFDGVGAVSLLDDVFTVGSEDLPMKIFRTHPDTRIRRDRLEAALVSFWSTPVVVEDRDVVERLNASRNSKQARRNDPGGRYVVIVPDEGAGLHVFDQQVRQYVTWFENTKVHDFAWSPQGQYIALIVNEGSQRQLWIGDRWGKKTKSVGLSGQAITEMSWSPQGNQLAILVDGPMGSEVMVTYLEADVLLQVGGDFTGESSIWLDTGLYFAHGDMWYHTSAPKVSPVTIRNPVPQVLQRQRILSPTVIKEGNTIRLTRPSLTIP
ncbi:MAG TPA: hypothetical protein DDZ66_11395 [Firmicutes bacterium]|nr:hypothetical protein [Bacillota bacterium]